MQTIAAKKTKVQSAIKRIKSAHKPTFQEWLIEEASAGRMILATSRRKSKLPAKPQETIDFWPAYNEARADRF